MGNPGNPLDPAEPLRTSADAGLSSEHPQAEILPGDSSTTQAEKIERHAIVEDGRLDDFEESPNKRVKLDGLPVSNGNLDEPVNDQRSRQKGVAPIKKEYLVDVTSRGQQTAEYDDDAAEASGKTQPELAGGRGGAKTKGGQNHSRQFGSSRDSIPLCRVVATSNEFSGKPCSFGDKCKHEHDIRRYLKDSKREDLQTFNALCPVWEVRGKCPAGWRCRFAGSHSKEIEHEDGRKELVLVTRQSGEESASEINGEEPENEAAGVVNAVSQDEKIRLRKKKHATPKSDAYIAWLNKQYSGDDEQKDRQSDRPPADGETAEKQENRARYVEPALLPSEKRRIYYGPETPVLAPLTTQGNLPFRRLCVELGAQVTWSEMAMGLPLLQGERAEWALMKAHESELTSPAYRPNAVVSGYDNSKDIKFGVQLAANKPWLAAKTTEVLTNLCPSLRAIDLNCGCPIDLVYRQGAGSALLDSPGKLEKLLRSMNTVSGEVPITVKIRMGTKDNKPTAEKLCHRLVMGGVGASEHGEKPAGVAAITLHGRSRQQRYSRQADWEYIAECATLVKKLKTERAEDTDTIREPDARDLPASNGGLPYFCGNGDVLSHVDYNAHIEGAGVDSCMIGRGALVKPWVFEEIAAGQYLDKSASERLGYVERFVRNGLEYWGSDEVGVGTTRRFLLEWLSFTCRYVPLGILEHLPPKFGDRPPAFRGRDEMETLLSSANYKDWIKISEMYLGPAHKDFRFQPKHKSNSYEMEAEG